MTEFVTLYGPYAALLLVGLSWVAKNVWPLLVKRDEQDRQERREERAQLVELVKNNTAAMTEVTGAINRLNDTVSILSRDVGFVYMHLGIDRPTTQDHE